MKNTIFTGAATALITPFTERGVDYEAMGRLIDFQIAEGIDALVITGTTGEATTLDETEYEEVIRFCVQRAHGKVPLIAGSGSNDTGLAISRTRKACAAGVDAVLLITPYYNKTTQKGIIAHFTAIADTSERPCILYNVPSRTGLNMEPETLRVLAEHPRIAGVKEANGNISQTAKDIRLCGEMLDIYSGNDDQTVPFLSLGAQGVISVAANVVPAEMVRLCRLYTEGKVKEAAELQLRLLDLMNQLMIETNPIPAKAACAAMGFGENRVRLPLIPMESKHKIRLMEIMKDMGLI